MESTEKIKQVLYGYITAGLIDKDLGKFLSYLSDDVIGIGMGEQGFVSCKKDAERVFLTTMKKDVAGTYQLDIQNIIINFTTDYTANVCAAVYLKRLLDGKETTSAFMQSLSMVKQKEKWYICALHASPIMFSKESIEAYPLTFADNALANLRSTLQKDAFELVNQSLSGGILSNYITNEDRYPLYFANDSMIQMLGYTKEEFIKEMEYDSSIIIFPEDKKRVLSEVQNALKSNRTFSLYYRLIKKDKSVIWIIEHGKKTTSNENRDIILSVFTEITKIIEMQQALQEKTSLLEEQADELAAQNEELFAQRQALEEQAKALEISEERFRLALEKTSNIIFDYDIISGNIMHSSTPKKIITLTSIKDAKNFLILGGTIIDKYMNDFEYAFEQIKKGVRHVNCVIKAKLETGKEVWNKISLTGVSDQNGIVLRAVGLIEDITQQKEAETAYKREEQYRQVLFSDAMAVYVINFSKGIFEDCKIMDNRCVFVASGENYDSFIRINSKTRISEQSRQKFINTFSRVSIMEAFEAGKSEVKLEYNCLNSDGTTMWMQTIIRLVVDTAVNEKKGFLYVIDINERKQKELELIRKSQTDPLTKLYNKEATEMLISEQLETAEAISAGTFMMIDIDHFKEINDTFGHPFGDKMLKEISNILSSNFRENDIISRLGGDEFGVFLSGISSKERIEKAAELLCEKFHSMSFRKPFFISCSIGISRCNGDIKTFEQLYREADLALYSVKENGRNGYAFYGQQEPQKSHTWIQNPEWILNEMELGIFICDKENYNIIYINNYLLELLHLKQTDCYGKKCYEALCFKKQPCDFCSLSSIEKKPVFERVISISHIKKEFLMRGQLIKWNGNLAHMEIIYDITNLSNARDNHSVLDLNQFPIKEEKSSSKSEK